MKNILRPILVVIGSLIILLSFTSTTYCQRPIAETNKIKFKLFEGEWKLKGDIWKTQFGGNYKEDVNPNRSFVVKAVSPENTIMWNCDYGGGAWATLLWTYHQKSGRVNHISNTTDNNIGVGVGEFDRNNALTIKIVYPNGCTNCHRIYTFHWINANEFEFKATIYENEKPTGDFYGATLLRKSQ
jgi:hypothetical protein